MLRIRVSQMSVGLCDVVVKYRGMEIADVEQNQTNQQQKDLEY